MDGIVEGLWREWNRAFPVPRGSWLRTGLMKVLIKLA